MFSLPHIGMKYTQRMAQYIPDEDGNFTIAKMEVVKGVIKCWLRTTRTEVIGYCLPNGTLSGVRITPRSNYRKTVDGYEWFRNGNFTIVGRYPWFKVSQTGEQVFLDYDGTFSVDYCNFIERCNDRRRLTRVRSKEKSSDKKRLRIKIQMVRSGGYDWQLLADGVQVVDGHASTRVMAERIAEDYRRRYVDPPAMYKIPKNY